MLLARAAESLYWFGRYLERAEDTARIIREHTNLMVDLPTIVPVTWKPLLAISGDTEIFAARYPRDDETAIVRYLVADRSNPSSVVSAVGQARENLRGVRELVPAELWQSVNDLYLFVAANHSDGVVRASRRRFLDHVVIEGVRCNGIVSATMSRDDAYNMLAIGTNIERADMTTRVIDVAAATIGVQGDHALHGDVQWSSVLRSLAGLQMFRRATHSAAEGAAAVRFLLGDRQFPRSFTYCTDRLAGRLALLAGGDATSQAAAALSVEAHRADLQDFDVDKVRKIVDSLQRGLATIDIDASARYFGVASCS